jgi:hypothetical protein
MVSNSQQENLQPPVMPQALLSQLLSRMVKFCSFEQRAAIATYFNSIYRECGGKSTDDGTQLYNQILDGLKINANDDSIFKSYNEFDRRLKSIDLDIYIVCTCLAECFKNHIKFSSTFVSLYYTENNVEKLINRWHTAKFFHQYASSRTIRAYAIDILGSEYKKLLLERKSSESKITAEAKKPLPGEFLCTTSPVRMVAKKDKIYVTQYKNPVYGEILLEQDFMFFAGNKPHMQKRNALLRGKTSDLKEIVELLPERLLTGRIQVREYLESEVPDDYLIQYLSKNYKNDEVYEKNITPYLKRDDDGNYLMCDKEYIVRFTDYDPTGEERDIIINTKITAVPDYNILYYKFASAKRPPASTPIVQVRTSSVTIKQNDNGLYVTPYPSNLNYGYIILTQTRGYIQGTFLCRPKRSCLLRGEIIHLNELLEKHPDKTLPGRLHIREYLERDIKEEDLLQFIGQDYTDKDKYDESIKRYLLRDKKDNFLTIDGEYIVRFTEYDSTGNSKDILIEAEITTVPYFKSSITRIKESPYEKYPEFDDMLKKLFYRYV